MNNGSSFRGSASLRMAFGLVILFSVALAVNAQNRNTITGFVFTQDRVPVGQIPVEVMNEVNQVLQRTRTDGSGRYFFGGLSSGRFTVRVMPYGTNLEEQSQEVEIINIPRPGGSTSDQAFKDFYLRVRKTGPDVKPISGTIFAQEVPAEAKKLYEKGLDELESNRTDAGIQSLLNAVKTFPEYYVALERLGREYIKQQNYEYARAVFIKLVSVNEKSFSGWYGLSFAAYALKESGIAIEAAKRATTLEQSSADAFVMLGISYRQAKNFPEAEKALLNARSLSKGQSADVHWNLALLYANNMNKFKEAADELEEYLKIAPEGAKTEEVKKLVARFREKAVAVSKFTQSFSF